MAAEAPPPSVGPPSEAGPAARGSSQPAWLTWTARALLVAATLVVAVAVLLPNAWLAELRRQWRWFSHMISQVERLWPAVDMVHVVMFAAVGLLLALAFPAWRWFRLLGVLVAMAGLSECVQIWVPGRTASLGEVGLDVVAGALGMLPVFAVRWLAGRRRVGVAGNVSQT